MQVELAANRGTYQVRNILTGNAQAGETYFKGEGKCYTCHSVTGDLKGIGSKFDDPKLLQNFFVMPGGRGGFGFAPVGPLLDPGVYMIRLTVGSETLHSSISVLEDVWMRVQ